MSRPTADSPPHARRTAPRPGGAATQDGRRGREPETSLWNADCEPGRSVLGTHGRAGCPSRPSRVRLLAVFRRRCAQRLDRRLDVLVRVSVSACCYGAGVGDGGARSVDTRRVRSVDRRRPAHYAGTANPQTRSMDRTPHLRAGAILGLRDARPGVHERRSQLCRRSRRNRLRCSWTPTSDGARSRSGRRVSCHTHGRGGPVDDPCDLSERRSP